MSPKRRKGFLQGPPLSNSLLHLPSNHHHLRANFFNSSSWLQPLVFNSCDASIHINPDGSQKRQKEKRSQ
jgi:hypothetical protein